LNMNLSLESIVILDAIDRRGSFAAAAEELHRVPSAITYGVRQLEESLNVRLFDRSGHRAVLTLAGEELLREGRRLLEAASTLEQRVKRVATGYEAELRIAISDLIPIERFYPLVERFYREDCGTRLRLMTEVFGGSWDALASGRADLAVGAPGDGPSGGGYTVQTMGSMRFIFAVAPSHPLAKIEPGYHSLSGYFRCGQFPESSCAHVRAAERAGCADRSRYGGKGACPKDRTWRGISAAKLGQTGSGGRAAEDHESG
jgi:DNA-binding transcriptional LysR family regulator